MQLPKRESVVFATEEISIMVEHPYTRYGFETHKHLFPTELVLSPYSYPARPYRWTIKRRWLYTGGYTYIEDLALETGIDYHSEYEPNPRIVKKSGKYETEEGCLSLIGVRKCTRYKDVNAGYLDMNMKSRSRTLADL